MAVHDCGQWLREARKCRSCRGLLQNGGNRVKAPGIDPEKELMSLRVRVANELADVSRMEEWLRSGKPAQLFFTEGPERRLAYLIEDALRRGR